MQARTHKGRPGDCCLQNFQLFDVFHRPNRLGCLPRRASFVRPWGRNWTVCQGLQLQEQNTVRKKLIGHSNTNRYTDLSCSRDKVPGESDGQLHSTTCLNMRSGMQ